MAGQKWMVQAADRTSLGHAGSWRANTYFPSNTPTLVEVLDQDDDPAKDPDPTKAPPHLIVGRKTWEAIKGDKVLAKWPAGDESKGAKTSEDPGELRRMLEAERQEGNRLRARVAELEGQAAGATATPAATATTEHERAGQHRRRGANE